MMLFLPCDIFAHRTTLERTHSESSIALLPSELLYPYFFVDPPGGNRFDLTQDIGHSMGGTQTHQQVHMIGDPANLFGYPFELVDYASKKCVKTWLPPSGDCANAVFCTEDKVIMQRKVS